MKKSLLTVSILLLSLACTKGPRVQLPADPDLLKLAPADSTVIIGGKIAPLAKAGLLAPLETFSANAGLNLAADLDEFLIAYNGKSPLAAFKGRVNQSALEEKLKARGVPNTTLEGKTIWGADNLSIAILDNRVVAAPAALLKPALTGNSGAPQTLRDLLATIPGDANVWGVSLGNVQLPVPERSNLANVNNVLSLVNSIVGSAKVANGVSFQATANSNDYRSARKVHDALRGALGFLRLSTPTDRTQILEALDALDIRLGQKEVKLTAYWTRDAIEALLAFRPTR
jgi:hypothetical protein